MLFLPFYITVYAYVFVFFMSNVIHVGSVGFTLISLLGIHCLAISVRCSVTFSVYLLTSSFLKLSQSVLDAFSLRCDD